MLHLVLRLRGDIGVFVTEGDGQPLSAASAERHIPAASAAAGAALLMSPRLPLPVPSSDAVAALARAVLLPSRRAPSTAVLVLAAEVLPSAVRAALTVLIDAAWVASGAAVALNSTRNGNGSSGSAPTLAPLPPVSSLTLPLHLWRRALRRAARAATLSCC